MDLQVDDAKCDDPATVDRIMKENKKFESDYWDNLKKRPFESVDWSDETSSSTIRLPCPGDKSRNN